MQLFNSKEHTEADYILSTPKAFIIETVSALSLGRSGGIRTPDPMVPNHVRYQTAPHSDIIPFVLPTPLLSPRARYSHA